MDILNTIIGAIIVILGVIGFFVGLFGIHCVIDWLLDG